MKIYQLHEYRGEYEDKTDTIIGSYMKQGRAEEEKAKAEIKEKELMIHSQRCMGCPFLERDDKDINALLLEYPDYCSCIALKESDWGIDCENFYIEWDYATFYIEEVEVEE